MVVHHAYSLHERIADRRTNKPESPLLQVPAHGIRFGGLRRHLLQRLPAVHQRLMVHELPEIVAEAPELALDSQECLGIGHCRIHLQSIANDARISQQSFLSARIVAGNFGSVKIVEGSPIALATLQDRRPTQTSLGTLQDQKLE